MTPAARFELPLPARMENLGRFSEAISDLARQAGFDEKRLRMIELAAEEALVNVIRYAYPEGNGTVFVTGDWDGRTRFRVEVRDQGRPFDVLAVPEPDRQADLAHRNIGGLGVFLIHRAADDVFYRREDDFNILTMVFVLNQGRG